MGFQGSLSDDCRLGGSVAQQVPRAPAELAPGVAAS